jgi:dimeric dUTPase (all-alpha-NTP-PPase superfamily)
MNFNDIGTPTGYNDDMKAGSTSKMTVERTLVLDLVELLETQRALQARMGNPTGTGEAGLKENVLHAIVELTEVLREINFKPWKISRVEVDRVKLATELTDVLQFWANAALAMGLTPDELTQALRAKWGVNHQRIDDGDVVEVQHD